MEFCDLKRQYGAYREEIDQAMAQVLQSAHYIHGPDVAALEKELAEFCGANHVVCCANGTDALGLALMALGLKPGDEVIVPAFSFFATAEMPALHGARLRFADVDPVLFNMDPQSVQALIGPKTVGIIAVSLFGLLADLKALQQIADQHGLWLLEDGAQSFGARNSNGFSCAQTALATTSFFPAKPLGCYGDGGAVFCQDEQTAQKVRLLANHGSQQRYHHEAIGLNSRLDSLQAAVLRVKLRHFEQELSQRHEAAQLYDQLLPDSVQKPLIPRDERSAWAQYTLQVENRDELQKFLQARGIPTAIHYPIPLHRQKALETDFALDPCPQADRLSQRVLSLPMHGMMHKEEIQSVCDALREWTLS